MRTDFNVFGYKTDDMLAVKTKRQMKKIFSEHGLKVAAGDVFHSGDEARVLAEKLGFPVIIKPNSGMEEFIDGDIVIFDGLTDHDGAICLLF